LIDLATKSTKQTACGQVLSFDVSLMPGLENLEAFNQFQYLKEKYPNLTCRFHRKDFESSLNCIRQGQMDLALVSEVYPITDEDIHKIALPAIQNYIVVNHKSPLAKFSMVSREQLKDEPFYLNLHFNTFRLIIILHLSRYRMIVFRSVSYGIAKIKIPRLRRCYHI
jgi:DNA-binding transcriptional LysR family regulator